MMKNNEVASSTESSLPAEKLKVCKELKAALSGDIGDIVAKHEEMILHYYRDVQKRAKEGFESAKKVSKIGFGVLIATLAYTLGVGTEHTHEVFNGSVKWPSCVKHLPSALVAIHASSGSARLISPLCSRSLGAAV